MKSIWEQRWNNYLLKEHRGKPCKDLGTIERLECEKNSKELEIKRKSRQKKDEETFPGKKEMTSLSRGVVEQKKDKKPKENEKDRREREYHDPETKWRNENREREDWVKIRKGDLDKLLELADEDFRGSLLVEPLEQVDEVKHNLSPDAIKQFCRDKGLGATLEDFLKRQNAYELSQKGDLNKK